MTSATLNLDTLTLKSGSHGSRTQGVCIMEAVAWYAGENHSDMPDCVSPVLRGYGMRLNDGLPEAERQQLKQFIPALVGTADDGKDQARRDLAKQVLMTEWLPQWLRLANLDDLAARAEAGAELEGAALRTALREIRDLTWQARSKRWEPLRVKVREAVEAKLKEQGTAADVDVAADVADVGLVRIARNSLHVCSRTSIKVCSKACEDRVRARIP